MSAVSASPDSRPACATRLEKMGDAELDAALPDICASYQRAVIDQLRGKTRHLLSGSDYRSLGLSGGVSNNRAPARSHAGPRPAPPPALPDCRTPPHGRALPPTPTPACCNLLHRTGPAARLTAPAANPQE